jgi:hypothetical protein
MAVLKQVTIQRHRKYLKPTGPKAVGILPAATNGRVPTKRTVHDPLRSKTVARPAQGKNSLSSV